MTNFQKMEHIDDSNYWIVAHPRKGMFRLLKIPKEKGYDFAKQFFEGFASTGDFYYIRMYTGDPDQKGDLEIFDMDFFTPQPDDILSFGDAPTLPGLPPTSKKHH